MHGAWSWIPRTTHHTRQVVELREYSKTDQAFRQTGNNVSHDPKLVEKGKKKRGKRDIDV